jgi:hypothetical protein
LQQVTFLFYFGPADLLAYENRILNKQRIEPSPPFEMYLPPTTEKRTGGKRFHQILASSEDEDENAMDQDEVWIYDTCI